MSEPKEEQPILLFPTIQEWESWLDMHGDYSSGIRMRLAKKNARLTSISYQEALDAALCYGWVDSRKEAYDDESWLQRFSPRRARSLWSKINRERVEALLAEGRMKAAGLQTVEDAKRNGQWDKAYESSSKAEIPEDFAEWLNRNEKARAFYQTLNRQNQYAILFRIQTAKKAETRAKRIAQFIAMLEREEKLYP